MHGNTGRLPKNTCALVQVEAVKRLCKIMLIHMVCLFLVVYQMLVTKLHFYLLICKIFVYRKYQEVSTNPVKRASF